MVFGLRATDIYTSGSMRPTDFVFQITDENKSSEAKLKATVEYQDFSLKGTDQRHKASIPDHIFLHPNSGADAIVSHPQDPRMVIMIQREHGHLGLPGGFVGYGEDPYFAAVRKFMEEVNFEITETVQVKKQNEDELDQKEEFEEVEKKKLVAAGPYPGFFGRVMMMTVSSKTKSTRGPLLGVYGVSDRDPRKQAVSFGFHMSIGDRFVNPVPGGDSQRALFCNVPELLARNLEEFTDEPGSHPLFELGEQMDEIDAQKVDKMESLKSGSTIDEVDPCAIEVDFDYLKMLNKYYLSMVSLGIITESGQLTEKAKTLRVYYSKDALKTAKSNNLL